MASCNAFNTGSPSADGPADTSTCVACDSTGITSLPGQISGSTPVAAISSAFSVLRVVPITRQPCGISSAAKARAE